MSRHHRVYTYAAQAIFTVKDMSSGISNRRKLIVLEISKQIWNYFHMCDSHAKHFSDSLIFVQAPVDYQLNDTCATTAKSSSIDEIDPSFEAFPNAQVMLDDDEKSRLAAELFLNTKAGKITAYKTRQRNRMLANGGRKLRRMLYYSGTQGPKDWFNGIVRSVPMQNKYDIAYDYNYSQEMGEKKIEKYGLDIDKQAISLSCTETGCEKTTLTVIVRAPITITLGPKKRLTSTLRHIP